MAGFFGLLDYGKPGPGVSKTGPKKKSFFVFWEIYFRKFWKLIQANLLYVLVSLPVVTGGLAQAGLTYVTRNYVREKHVFLWSDFFDTIKKNWKQALPVGILELGICGLLAYAISFYWEAMNQENSGWGSVFLFAGVLAVGAIFCFMRYYVYLQLITFRMTMKQLFKNSFLLAMVGIKQNLLISVVLVALYALVVLLLLVSSNYILIAMLALLLLYVLFFPAFRSYLIQFLVFPVVKKMIIDPYYQEHPQADIEQRRNLNLEIEDAVQEQEEPVFEDRGETAATAELEEQGTVIPKQYSAEELRRGKRLQRRDQIDRDDDDTI